MAGRACAYSPEICRSEALCRTKTTSCTETHISHTLVNWTEQGLTFHQTHYRSY